LTTKLSNSGFALVAKWRSTAEMQEFLKRVIELDIQGEITDRKMFDTVAACCFSDGKPQVAFESLRSVLRKEGFVSSGNREDLEPGDLVLVDGDVRATILNLDQYNSRLGDSARMVHLRYEDPERRPDDYETQVETRGVRTATGLSSTTDEVALSRLTPRAEMPFIPGWVLPESMTTSTVSLASKIGRLSNSCVFVQRTFRDILTWRRKLHALIFFLVIVAIAACAITAEMHMWTWLYDEKESFNHEFANRVANPIKHGYHWLGKHVHIAWSTLKWLFGYFLFALFVIWYVYRATWLTEVWAIWSIMGRWLTMWRLAPKKWKFFKYA